MAWYIEKDSYSQDLIINDAPSDDDDRLSIAFVYADGIDGEQQSARLIAAAPDLLNACMAARDIWIGYTLDSQETKKALEILSNVIEKATGGNG